MAATRILEHIYELDFSAIFTTRDVLQYGTRTAVDQCLSRLVRSHFIVRLARGVFTRDPNIKVTIEEIATIKAVAFGRKILDHATKILLELKARKPFDTKQKQYSDDGTEILNSKCKYSPANSFAIDGHSSRFQSVLGPVEFHGIAPRKAKLSESKAGRRMYGLWYFGDDDRIATAVKTACRDLNRKDRIDLRRASALMPAWLHHLMLPRYSHSVASERFAV